jgi:beta-glucosidase
MGYSTGPSMYDKILPSKLNADSLKMEAIKTVKKKI